MREKVELYKVVKPTVKELNFFRSWSVYREKPRWRYILLNGILKEGLVFFAMIKMIQYLFEREAFSLFYSSLSGLMFLIFEIIFWIFGGFVIGWFKYNSREIEYELIKGLMQ